MQAITKDKHSSLLVDIKLTQDEFLSDLVGLAVIPSLSKHLSLKSGNTGEKRVKNSWIRCHQMTGHSAFLQ
jgi:hypothetical protein